jgi:tRNA (guanine26-N2/guanine27-N2)-dimethyltransferase
MKGFVRHLEGRTTLLVPTQSLGKEPPDQSPAFFNPRGRVVRDVSVLAFETFAASLPGGGVLADPLAGVGGRSLRVAVECPSVKLVRANDLNPAAIDAAKAAASMNRCRNKMEFTLSDANLFLAQQAAPELRPLIVDVDPFGTPAPFVESSLRALGDGGLLAITATDTAVLSGLYPEVAYRKYGARALRTDYSRETMLRLLMGLVAHRALVYDMVAEPLFCHADQHYARVYCRIRISAADANASLDRLGYVMHCFKCGNREAASTPVESCRLCGGKMKAAGPVWVGDLHQGSFASSLEARAVESNMKRYVPLFMRAKEELGFPPYYFRIPFFTDQLGVASVSPSELAARLMRGGFRAVRASVDPQGVKTDAGVKEVTAALGRA